MQDPNEDTEWNDALRKRGIIPEKEVEVTEQDLVNMVDAVVDQKLKGKDLSEMTGTELDDIEDEIDEDDERIFEQYRRQRLEEMRAAELKKKFGNVQEITKVDYVREVNEAGEGIYVVLHVYKQGFPLCSLINQHLSTLAHKFPETKFLRSVSSVCIANYPDKHLPSIFVYKDANLLKQYVGPAAFGANIPAARLELMLASTGAVKSELEPPSQPKIHDVMESAIRDSCLTYQDKGDNDWS